MDWLLRRGVEITLIAAGGIFLAVALGLLSSQRPIKGGVVTTGRIVGHFSRTGEGNTNSKFPIIEFTDQEERVHRFESELGGSGGGIEGEVGQAVQVRYDPANPSHAQWADQPGVWLLKGLAIFGGLLLVMGLAVGLWRTFRRPPLFEAERKRFPPGGRET